MLFRSIASLAQPDKTRRGKVVFAYLEVLTLGQLLQKWAKAHNTKAYYLQIQKEDYFTLFPGGAEEMDLGMRFWEFARENWFVDDGSLSYRELDIDLTKLQSIEESMKFLPKK